MLHYWLPDREIVRIVGTEVKRVDVESGAPFWDRADIGTNEEATRDVRFINAEKKNGRSMVFRNEDTGWGWPPYLKFDSGDVTSPPCCWCCSSAPCSTIGCPTARSCASSAPR